MRSGTAADGVRADQPVALAVDPVARPGHRPGSSRATRPGSAPRTRCSATRTSGSIRRRSCCSRPARSATPRPRVNLRTLDLALGKTPPGRRSAAASSSAWKPSTCSTVRTSASPTARLCRRPDGEPVLATFGRITNTVTSARQIQLGVRACSSSTGLPGRGLDELAAR